MFKKLSDFGYVRTSKEAVGFYIAYFFLIIVASGIVAAIIGGIESTEDFKSSVQLGRMAVLISYIFLSFLILQSKKLLHNWLYVTLAVFSGVIIILGGGTPLGLLIPAYLTTLEKKIHEEKKK